MMRLIKKKNDVGVVLYRQTTVNSKIRVHYLSAIFLGFLGNK